jgi:AcrR family transcriptional regulator
MPRNERRKEQRPEEIMEAALEEFAVKGYAETRLDDVASRAGISKGLVYVYFKTKEELFKAVIRTFIIPRVDALIAEVERSRRSSEELIRGPVLSFMKALLMTSRIRIVVRLLIAEGPKHPDLLEFYHREVVSRGMRLLRLILARGVTNGEFRPSPYQEFPQLFVAPMLLAMIWQMLFARHQALDIDRYLEAHIGIVVQTLKTGVPVETEPKKP